MAELLVSEKVLLKNHPEINEAKIQQFIFDNPSILGLGELIPIQREKIQPSGGRLDILLSDPDGEERYEVEIQLGSTDASHIIRTIEYWDTEKKRYPKYNHCAVIVAEEITGRFMNVISLFNGSIPLIALQMSAIKHGEDLELIFTKVLDRVDVADEDEEVAEPTDRSYWEKKCSSNLIKTVDKMFEALGDLTEGYELKYNKFYIGLAKSGVAKNFVAFRPTKTFVKFCFKGPEDQDKIDKIEAAGFDVSYASRWKEYTVRIKKYSQFEDHKDLFTDLVKQAKDYYMSIGLDV